MTYNIDFAIRYDGLDEFSIMSAPRGSGVLLKTPVVENIDRQSLRNLRSLIDGALNRSREEAEDDLA